MELSFTKMHGLGNDFVVLDALARPIELSREQFRFIADRHFGIGCDQVLLIAPARQPGHDVHYRIFNADGGEVEQCGNGARCVASYLRSRGLAAAETVVAETARGAIRLYFEPEGRVRVDMGAPGFEPSDLPMQADRRLPTYDLDVDGEHIEFSAVSMGNPHAVLCVADVTAAPVEVLGPKIERHPFFPQGVNAGFMQVLDRSRIRLRVFERGVGETLACGSGACAAVAAGRMLGLLDERVDVELPGGHLWISWDGEGQPVWMSGPATHVFEGRIRL